MTARERLDRKVDPLMPLQIVIAVEALRALVAFKRAIVVRSRLSMGRMVRWVPPVQMLHAGQMAAGETGHKSLLDIAHQRHLPAGIVHVRHDGSVHRGERI